MAGAITADPPVTPSSKGSPQASPGVIEQRKLRPVMAWALLGSAFLALMAYEWGASLIEGDLKPTTIGRDGAPDWATFSVHAQEVALGLVALGTIWFFLI